MMMRHCRENKSLYDLATEAIASYIEIYLDLTRRTSGFNLLQPQHLGGVEEKVVILSGINSSLEPISATAEEIVAEWQRVQAIPFDTETAITNGVYRKLRNTVEVWLNDLEKDTKVWLGMLSIVLAYLIKASLSLNLLRE